MTTIENGGVGKERERKERIERGMKGEGEGGKDRERKERIERGRKG